MSEEMNLKEYDEDKSVEFIRESLPPEVRDEISDDEINYVVDLVYDYYEESGLFDDEDDEDDIIIDEDEIVEYVIKAAHKDKVRDFTDNQIKSIVMGELAYCDSLNLFD